MAVWFSNELCFIIGSISCRKKVNYSFVTYIKPDLFFSLGFAGCGDQVCVGDSPCRLWMQSEPTIGFQAISAYAALNPGWPALIADTEIRKLLMLP